MSSSQLNGVVVVAVVRNCEETLPAEIDKLARALVGFEKVSWFLVESDSDDRTLEVLIELKQEYSGFEYVTLGTLENRFPLRTERLAFCRNRYLEELSAYQEEFVLVADLDGTNSHLTLKGVMSCWKHGNWDVCTANQVDRYYDIWALRHPLWSPNDCWKLVDFLVEFCGLSRLDAIGRAIYSRQVRIPSTYGPIEVDSAFGGLAIYRRDSIGPAEYRGIDDNGMEICEHVAFHSQMKSRGKRIIINPGLINCKAPIEHLQEGQLNEKKSVISLFSRSLSYLVRRIKNLY